MDALGVGPTSLNEVVTVHEDAGAVPIKPHRLYTDTFVRDLLDVDRRTLQVWRKRGLISTFKLAGSQRCVRYLGSELLAFLERSRVATKRSA